ncbi:MAG TPA: S8 family serine peptidase [Thermoanaerobaculia bacterium]|nr:S8 family serine peptidase [Thermoanaerobaculia bacterium]
MFKQRCVLVLAVAVAAALFTVKCHCWKYARHVINAGEKNVIPDHYIVLFKPGTKPDQVSALETTVEQQQKGQILVRYTSGVLGFAAALEPEALKNVLANRHVLWVEADQKMSSSSVTEPASSTGLDRIDQRLLPLNSTFQYTDTGEGVDVYVLDNGIRTSHQEFEDRAIHDFTASGLEGTEDCADHGTHVAGTVGGKTYGVAKKVRLHSVRVMDCKGQGELSNVIAGVEWITENRIKSRPAVANMSISGETGMPSLDTKVHESINSGVTYVVTAHNRGRDACNYSPARIVGAITVGAVNPKTDVLWVMSNHGACVDVYAPGVAVLSAGVANDTDTAVKAGTSMATAYVAGVAALVLQRNPNATPHEVWNKIHENNNVFAVTPDWNGITNRQDLNTPTAAVPNELLQMPPQ